ALVGADPQHAAGARDAIDARARETIDGRPHRAGLTAAIEPHEPAAGPDQELAIAERVTRADLTEVRVHHRRRAGRARSRGDHADAHDAREPQPHHHSTTSSNVPWLSALSRATTRSVTGSVSGCAGCQRPSN